MSNWFDTFVALSKTLDRSRAAHIIKYNASQPRHPKGTPLGGQWVGGVGRANAPAGSVHHSVIYGPDGRPIATAWTDEEPTGGKFEHIHRGPGYEAYNDNPNPDNPAAEAIWQALPGLSHVYIDEEKFKPEHQAEVAQAVTEWAAAYPNAAETVKVFRMADEPQGTGTGAAAYMETGYMMYPDGSYSIGSSVTILPRAIDTTFVGSDNAVMGIGIPYLAGYSLRNTTLHELGHSLNLAYGVTQARSAVTNLSVHSKASVSWDWMNNTATSAMRAHQAEFGAKSTQSVSGYANKNNKEWVAETHAVVTNNLTRRMGPASRKFMSSMYDDWDAAIGQHLDTTGGSMTLIEKGSAAGGIFIPVERIVFRPLRRGDQLNAALTNARKTLGNRQVRKGGTKAGGGGKQQGYGYKGLYGGKTLTKSQEVDQLNNAQYARYESAPASMSHTDAMYHAFYGGSNNEGLVRATDEMKAALKIPPAWRYVMVAEDMVNGNKSGLLAKGIDAAGRTQPRYSEAKTKAQSQSKFERHEEFTKKLPKLDKKLRETEYEDPSAAALSLIRKTGMRQGSLADTRAAEQAFGATTLQAKHVTINKDSVRLQFTGKKGVSIDITVKDKGLVDLMTHWKAGKTHSQPLFPGATGAKTNAILKPATGSKFVVKDLRTAKANDVALRTIARMPKPTTQSQFNKQRNAVGDAVSKTLGNNRSEALKSYINPAVFNDWAIGE